MLVSKGLQSFIILVLSRENGTLCSLCVAITIQSVFCIVYFEAVAPGLDDASNNLLKICGCSKDNFSENLSEIHISWAMPKESPSIPFFSVVDVQFTQKLWIELEIET